MLQLCFSETKYFPLMWAQHSSLCRCKRKYKEYVPTGALNGARIQLKQIFQQRKYLPYRSEAK